MALVLDSLKVTVSVTVAMVGGDGDSVGVDGW